MNGRTDKMVAKLTLAAAGLLALCGAAFVAPGPGPARPLHRDVRRTRTTSYVVSRLQADREERRPLTLKA